jgi:integrase
MKGSIIERRGKRGVSYLLKFDAGDDPVTGKRRQRYETVRGSKRDAQARLRELLGAVDKGQHVDPSRETVGDFLDRWFTDWANANRGAKTNERDAELVRLHIKPRIGAIRLQRLTRADLAGLYAVLQRAKADDGAGLAPRTARHVHRVLSKALGYAVELGLLEHSPAAKVTKPRVSKAEVQILSAEQIAAVLAALRGRVLFLPIAVALATGLRRGELLALRWDDLDLEAKTLRVDEAMDETLSGLAFKKPKTDSGRRTISLPASLIPELRAHRDAMVRSWAGLRGAALPDNAAVLDRLPPETLVFGVFDQEAGAWLPRRPRNFTHAWSNAVKSLKLPAVTLHALRHTHASQLIAAGVDIVTVSRRLGHASPTITLGVYAHLFGSTDTKAAEVVDKLFANATGTASA